MTIIGNKKLQFLSYVFEFLVLFLSIYIAFELEEWDEEQDFTSREEAYLVAMQQDLSKDLNQLNRRVIEYDEKLHSAYRVLELLKQPYESSQAEIAEELKSNLFDHFNYNPINNTLETLKTSGDLKLVKNLNFKILLSELDKSYASTIRQGEVFNDYIEGMEWSGFFINNFDTENFQVLEQRPAFTTLFKNRVRHYISLVESYYFHMQGSYKKSEEVKIALEAEMRKRNFSFQQEEAANNQINESDLKELDNEIDDLLEELDGDKSPTKESKDEESPSDIDIDKETEDLLEELEGMGG